VTEQNSQTCANSHPNSQEIPEDIIEQGALLVARVMSLDTDDVAKTQVLLDNLANELRDAGIDSLPTRRDKIMLIKRYFFGVRTEIS
jgi:hypothetical protein